MVECVLRQDAYGLIDDRSSCQCSPRPPLIAAGSATPGPAYRPRTPPQPASNTAAGPVKPSRASSAACSPHSAARPTCSRFDIALSSTNAQVPPVNEPARPIAQVSASASSPSTRPAAAAAANVPHTPVECQPRSLTAS